MNLNGLASDLTATFDLIETDRGCRFNSTTFT